MAFSPSTPAIHSVIRLSPDLMRERIDDAMDVYLAAMHYRPECRSLRRDPWEEATYYPTWNSYGAFTTPLASLSTNHDPLIGITFGYRGNPHSWWSSRIAAGMRSAGYQATTITSIMDNYFELSELHVLPSYQGHGLGTRLLDSILQDCQEHHVLLSTPEVPGENNAAWRLYRHMGFNDLLRNFTFPGDSRPFGILIRTGL